MATETHGGVTFQGNPLTTIGDKPAVGEKAPDFMVSGSDLQPVSLADSAGKIRLISVVPSLDTGICDLQTRRMNEEAANLGDDVVVLTISAEHPFNQKRWCGAAEVDQVEVLSDHMSMSFGAAYGLHIKELRLNQRAMLVIDKDDMLRYAEYIPEIAQFPDYDGVLAAVKEVAGA